MPPKRNPEKLIAKIGLDGRCEALQRISLQLEAFSQSPCRVLVMGEIGTGKYNVARALIGRLSGTKFSEIPGKRFFGDPEGFVEAYHGEGKIGPYFPHLHCARPHPKSDIPESAVFISRFDRLNPANQSILGNCFEVDQSLPRKMKVIGTARASFYEKLKTGKVSPEIFFGFDIRVVLPPLRQRWEDLDLIVAAVVRNMEISLQKTARKIRPDAFEGFRKYDWPGNMHELVTVIDELLFSDHKGQLHRSELEMALIRRKEEGRGESYRKLEILYAQGED